MKARLFSACVANQVHNLMILGDFVEHFQRALPDDAGQLDPRAVRFRKAAHAARDGACVHDPAPVMTAA